MSERRPKFSEPETPGQDISRRKFLKGALGAGTGVILGAADIGDKSTTEEDMETKRIALQETQKKELHEACAWLRQYGIALGYSQHELSQWERFGVKASNSETAQVIETIQTVISELKKYPPQLLKNLNLKGIYIGENIVDRITGPIGGAALVPEPREAKKHTGFIILSRALSLIDIVKSRAGKQFLYWYQNSPVTDEVKASAFVQFVVHHELYHILSRQKEIDPHFMEQWQTLMDPSITNDRHENNSVVPIVSNDDPRRQPGSVRNYGLTTDTVHHVTINGKTKDIPEYQEDQADVFALIMSDPERAIELHRVDPILLTKSVILQQESARLTNGALNNQYWSEIFQQAGFNIDRWEEQRNATMLNQLPTKPRPSARPTPLNK